MKEEVEILDTELRQYLLGELSSDEDMKIEEQLLVDGNAIEQMMMVENELIDDYLTGTLPPSQREKYQTLFLATREGQQKVKAARVLKSQLAKFREPEPTFLNRLQAVMARVFSPPVLQAIAALLVVGLGVFGWRMFMRQSEDIYLKERPLETRISGALYLPFTGASSAANQADTAKMKAAERALQNPSTTRNADALHKLGNSYLSAKNFAQAVIILREAVSASSNDPALHIDLAVALMESAKTKADAIRDKDFAESRGHLEEALRLQPNSPEALFNLALLYQTQKQWKEAETGWRQYLAVDPNSKWSKEAARNLDAAIKGQN
ncbi:MAG: tetratricopeptide repeat protein [Blastocatellia bacterium]